MAAFLADVPSPSPELARDRWVRLCGAVRDLEQTLAAPAGEVGWRISVVRRLAELREAFAEHVLLTEGKEGFYAELVDHAPRVSPGVHRLVCQDAALRDAIDAVCLRVPGSEPAEIRSWVDDLLRELSRYRQRGADLVYDAYETDIGGET